MYTSRAEALKKVLSSKTGVAPNLVPTNKPVDSSGKVVPPLGFGAFSDNNDEEGSNGPRSNANRSRSLKASPNVVNVGQGSYSKEEIDVLRYSYLNL